MRNGLPKPSVRKEVIAVLNSRVEHKHFTTVVASANYVVAGAVASMSTPIILGSNSNERDGAQIKPETLKVRWMSQNSSATALSQARLIVFQDRQANGAIAAVTDVLATAEVNSQYSPVIQMEQKRFRILCDKTMDLNPYVAGPAIHTMELVLKPSGPITYNGTTNAATAQGKNAINYLLIGTAVTSQYVLSYDVGYTDS
jgi:hypothetical protein